MTNEKELLSQCINFVGAKNSNGYGTVRIFGKQRLAHVIAFKLANPERIIGTKCVCHKCDNKICINPNHLFLGTRIENNKDRDLKGRNVSVCGSKNGMSKLNEKRVREIKNTLKYYDFKSFAELGRKYGVRWQTIQAIAKGRTWKNV